MANLQELFVSRSQESKRPLNQLLAALPQEDYERLLPDLKSVHLVQKRIVYSAGDWYDYAYFPNQSIISSVAIMKNGSVTEIGVIGNEGMIGLPIILGSDRFTTEAIVQVGNSALRIPAQKLKAEFDRREALYHLLLRYTQARIIQLGQTAACNCYHTIPQKFARWLLTVRDSVRKDKLDLTQEFISQMLGVRRAGVTEIAGQFQKAGMIRYSRGHITILDQERLEATSCECYQLIADEFSRLLGTRQE